MNKKTIIIIIITIIVIAGIGYWIYQSTIEPEEITEQEQACIDSGGEVRTSPCCEATGDFPNLCLIGPCGCSPDSSREIKICDCGPDKCFDGSKCVFLDEILNLFENLEQETGIDFSEEQEVEFQWYVEEDGKLSQVTIQGKGFEVKGVSSEDYRNVESFFRDKDFEIDLYNIASGTVVGLIGYKKGEIVCTIVGRMWLDEQGMLVEEDKNDIEVKCGKTAETVGLANPAAVYCLEIGGELMSVTTPEGAAGYCILPDGRTCAQWELFYSEGEECVPPEE